MRPSDVRVRVLALLVAALTAGPGAARAEASSEARTERPGALRVAAGRYVLRGTARTNVTVLPERDYPLDVLALVAPGDRPGSVRLHLRSRGHSCELRARVEEGEALVLEPGQTCRVELHDVDRRGVLEARLRSGSGRLAHRELSLQLAWDVSGEASLSSGGRVVVPGTSVEVQVPRSPAVPVRGTVDTAVSGLRDEPQGSGARDRRAADQ